MDTDLYNDTITVYLNISAPMSDPNLTVQYLNKTLKKTEQMVVPTSIKI